LNQIHRHLTSWVRVWSARSCATMLHTDRHSRKFRIRIGSWQQFFRSVQCIALSRASTFSRPVAFIRVSSLPIHNSARLLNPTRCNRSGRVLRVGGRTTNCPVWPLSVGLSCLTVRVKGSLTALIRLLRKASGCWSMTHARTAPSPVDLARTDWGWRAPTNGQKIQPCTPACTLTVAIKTVSGFSVLVCQQTASTGTWWPLGPMCARRTTGRFSVASLNRVIAGKI